MDVSTVTETVSQAVPQSVPVLSTFLIGLGTVFVALIALVYIIKIMGYFCAKLIKNKPEAPAAPKSSASAPKAVSGNETIENKAEVVAAASAAIATVMGKDVEAIRITSIKKVN